MSQVIQFLWARFKDVERSRRAYTHHKILGDIVAMNTHRMMTLIVIGLVSFFVAACGPNASPSTPTPVYTQVTEATLKKGSDIPVPTGDVILTVTGNVGTHNVGEEIQMDLASIEAVGLVDYTLTDPFEKREIAYQGPLMSSLLELWQVPDTATTLNMVALNDYAVDVPLKDLREYPVIFALKADGAYMPISTRGPAMLVYPYDDFTFDQAVYNDYWIWQIKSIDVR
jgi:hypothetical protein